jgi:hypothetical protein
MNTTGSKAEFSWPEQGSTVRPLHREHAGEVIRRARTDGISVGSAGAAYQWDFSNLDEVIQFHPPDMILSVESGVAFHAAKDMVEAERLWLPLDTPADRDLSIADFLAEDISLSWLSHLQGTARDWVMKITVADDNGEIVKSGAALVKNVAGYMLAPLYIGARHALGPIIDVSFRLLPLPTDLRLIQWGGLNLTFIQKILEYPLAVASSSAVRSPWEGLRLIREEGEFRLDGITRYSQDKIMAWVKNLGGDSQPTIAKVDVPPREHELGTLRPAVEIQVMPSRVGQIMTELPESVPSLVCYPAAGVVRIGELDSTSDKDSLKTFLASVAAGDGRMKALHPETIPLLPPDNAMTNDQKMYQRVKDILDPAVVFGPLPEYP